ncbi:Uncharacterised protein [Vibrio cholerae]|nr:Uncharacterised protein [Vibrio cholerae]CSD33098.1 Uncharacterised protein [Vibrio cholerae]CSD50197.1 Uncharacterised protein [Vibrio cholerae]
MYCKVVWTTLMTHTAYLSLISWIFRFMSMPIVN